MAESNRKSSVSGASTPQGIGEYWDSHSLEEAQGVREVEFEIRALRRHRVTVDPDLYEQVESAARVRGVSPETLVNRWLTEKLLATVGAVASAKKRRSPARR